MYKYIKRVSYSDISYELQVCKNTATLYVELGRDAIFEFHISSNEKIGGLDGDGLPKIVEVDKRFLFKAKYNRGRRENNQWYIGGIERGTKKAFIVPVATRDTATIVDVITTNILPNTIFITDQWRAYSSAINQVSNYTHRTVNHTYNFVNPLDSTIYTQNIEGFWSLSKQFLRQKNSIHSERHFDYLIQCIWDIKLKKCLI